MNATDLVRRWYEWARAHGHLQHAEGLARDSRELLEATASPSPSLLHTLTTAAGLLEHPDMGGENYGKALLLLRDAIREIARRPALQPAGRVRVGYACFDMRSESPCDQCAKWVATGIACDGVRDGRLMVTTKGDVVCDAFERYGNAEGNGRRKDTSCLQDSAV